MQSTEYGSRRALRYLARRSAALCVFNMLAISFTALLLPYYLSVPVTVFGRRVNITAPS